MSAQELSQQILQDVIDGTQEADAGIYALEKLQEFAEESGDTVSQEIFSQMHANIIADCEEVDETDEDKEP